MPQHFIRINSDATVKTEGSLVGIVARKYEGEILKVWVVLFHSDNVELAKAFGIFQGLIKAKEECEFDAKRIVHSLNNTSLQDLH